MKKSIAFELGGKKRSLFYGLNALAALEGEVGRGANEFLADLDKGQVTMSEIRAWLWAGLLHGDPELTLEQVGSLVDEEGVDNVVAKIVKASKV